MIGKERILAAQELKPVDATASLEALAKQAQAHRQTGDGTLQTAQVFATLFVYGNGERRHREEHREEAIVRRQHPGTFLQRAEPPDFSWLPPERDRFGDVLSRTLRRAKNGATHKKDSGNAQTQRAQEEPRGRGADYERRV